MLPMIESLFSIFPRTTPLSSTLRYEFKLAGEDISPARARSWIMLHPEGFRVAFPPRVVNNLYLDTVDLKSFNDNLGSVSARQKLRLRWYGLPEGTAITNPVLELKLKDNLLGKKKRQELTCTMDLARSYLVILKMVQAHADLVWRSWLQIATQAVLINRYRREYFVSPDKAIRATLDYAQVAFDQRLSSRPNLTRPLPLQKLVVIEVKAAPEHFERLERVMGFFPMLRTRNSKYVSGVMGGAF
jgi:hypothetical protein